MRIRLIIAIIFFILGFLIHAFFFPDLLHAGITSIPDILTTSKGQQNTLQPTSTTITFNGTDFSQHIVTIPFSRYIIIKNISSTAQMWLVSTDPQLTTSRGYQLSEAVQDRMDKKGQFEVEEKNSKAKLLIIVK